MPETPAPMIPMRMARSLGCDPRLVDEHATEDGVPKAAVRIDAELRERGEEATAPITEVLANDLHDILDVLELLRPVGQTPGNLQPLSTELRRKLGPPFRSAHPHD